MDFVDSSIDIIEFILLLAGVCIISLNIIVSNNKTLANLQYDINYDKTFENTEGDKASDFDIEAVSLSKQDVAMELCSQNSYLVSPVTVPNIEDPMEYQTWKEKEDELKNTKSTKFKIGNKTIDLQGRAQYDTGTAIEVLNAINNWESTHGGEHKYKIMFSMENTESIESNVYRLYYLKETSDGFTWVACE